MVCGMFSLKIIMGKSCKKKLACNWCNSRSAFLENFCEMKSLKHLLKETPFIINKKQIVLDMSLWFNIGGSAVIEWYVLFECWLCFLHRNGTNVEGSTHKQVVDLIRSGGDKLTLTGRSKVT